MHEADRGAAGDGFYQGLRQGRNHRRGRIEGDDVNGAVHVLLQCRAQLPCLTHATPLSHSAAIARLTDGSPDVRCRCSITFTRLPEDVKQLPRTAGMVVECSSY